MKKFCNSCGNQLELSQRFCNECGAVNPFFISTFTLLSDQSDELEKLRLEKERIEKELLEKEEKQAEFMLQEKLRKDAEEAEKLKSRKLENEKLKKDYSERSKLELNLKEEIERVKEENKQYKKETIDLVKEVREELQLIEEDNKRLKEAITAINSSGKGERHEIISTAVPDTKTDKPFASKGALALLFIVLIGLGGVVTYGYILKSEDRPAAKISSTMIPEPRNLQEQRLSAPSDNVVQPDTLKAPDEKVKKPVQPLDSLTALKAEPAEKKVEVPPAEEKKDFVLTVAKVKRDLTGKKISGCGIVINSASEIKYINDLVLVEKLPSGYLKYKFTTGIVQDNETYTAAPYIYYSSGGSFIKMDGTNCE